MLFICKAPETGSNSTKESKRVTNHIRQQSRSVRGFYYLCFLQKTGKSIQKQKPYSKSIFRNTVSDQHFGTLDIWQFIMTTSSLIEWILLRLLSWNSDKLSLVCPDNAIKLRLFLRSLEEWWKWARGIWSKPMSLCRERTRAAAIETKNLVVFPHLTGHEGSN